METNLSSTLTNRVQKKIGVEDIFSTPIISFHQIQSAQQQNDFYPKFYQ